MTDLRHQTSDLRHQTSDLWLGSQKLEVGSQNNTPYRKQDSCLSNRRMRHLMLPSPARSRLGLRGLLFVEATLDSLSLRPGDSLTIPRTALSVGFIRFVSSTGATQATGLLTLAPVGLFPTEDASIHWTHSLLKNPSAGKWTERASYF